MDYNELSAWIQDNYPDDYETLLELDSDGDLTNGFTPEDDSFMEMWNDIVAAYEAENGTYVKESEESDIKPH